MAISTIGTNLITDGTIATADIADDAVTSAKLDTNIDIAGTLDVTGVLTADNNATIAGTLTTSGNATVGGTLTSNSGGGNAVLGSHLDLGDNQIVRLGASDDLQIWHDGTNNIIRATGDLLIQRNTSPRSAITITDSTGAVDLAYGGSTKLATISGGVEVTGMLGLGTTPPTDSHTTWNQFFIGQKGSLISERLGSGGIYGTILSDNLYIDSDTGSYANIITNESSAYTQEAGIHRFYSQASGTAGAAVTLSEKMRIASNGSVGINQPSPSSTYVLDVGGAIRSTTTAPSFNLQETDASNQHWQLGSYAGNFSIRDVTGGAYPVTVQAGADANSLYIDSSGDVGIGTSSPSFGLSVESDNGSGYAALFRASSSDPALTIQTTSSITQIQGLNNALSATNNIAMQLSGGNVGIGTASPGSQLTVTKAGDGNSPILHVTDTADTEVAWFEGNRAGDTGAFIAVRHNPSSQAESNRSGIKFQADDDGGNVTNYAKITQYIEDNTNTTEDARLGINVMSDGSDNEVVNIRKDQFIYKGDAGSSFIRVDNRADGHDTGFEIYQNGSRKWEIHSDDSASDGLELRPDGAPGKFHFTQDGKFAVGATSASHLIEAHSGAVASKYDGSHHVAIRGLNGGQYIQYSSANALTFMAIDSYPNSGASAKATITTAGRLLVGSTSELSPNSRVFINANSNSTNPALNLKAATTTSSGSVLIFFAGDSDEVGSVSMSNLEQGSGVSYNSGSDARWKDVTGEARGLEVINKLNPVAFNWKKSGLADEGLIAQEVQPHIPNIVKEGGNGFLQMDYSKLVTPLIKAVQEQQEQIEELKAKIATLESS